MFVTAQAQGAYVPDPHSFANPNEVVVKHIDLDWKVDFEQKRISGSATLSVERSHPSARLHLDTRDLEIARIVDADTQQTLTWHYGRGQKDFGQELIVDLSPHTRRLRVDYQTSNNAHALQWLNPQQTADKTHPFMFSQAQSIHARSMLPLQDSPAVRITYTAKVQVPKGLMALMSAENPQTVSENGEYFFRMPQTIPPYLIAIAVGNVRFQATSGRTGVYAEPSVLEAAAWEFAELEHIVEFGEKSSGIPYAWGRYDILIMPPSFPLGGMENPRLTFLSPTLIAGDRSLVYLAGHEEQHSRTGNKITHANAEHFALTEGLTTYWERRGVEAMRGIEEAELAGSIAKRQVSITMSHTEPQYRKLRTELAGVDPDEVYSDIPYEMGSLFFVHLERVLGRERFDAFYRDYLKHFWDGIVTTEQFIEFLEDDVIKGDDQLRKEIATELWFYGEGLPSFAPSFEPKTYQMVESLIQKWQASGRWDEATLKGFSTRQWKVFLQSLPRSMSKEALDHLNQTFELSQKNAEVRWDWLELGIESKYPPALVETRAFLKSVGRVKFVNPLYLALIQNGYRDEALSIFDEAKDSYHNVIALAVTRIFEKHPCKTKLAAGEDPAAQPLAEGP